MAMINGQDVRSILLAVIDTHSDRIANTNNSLQMNIVLQTAVERLDVRGNQEQILLTEWYDLFRTGILAWGHNLSNPYSPFFHLTARGEQAVDNRTRDPANPTGYLNHLDDRTTISVVSRAYLMEGLECYVAGFYKAAAVMVGASAERIILDLRDTVTDAISAAGGTIPRNLNDWRVRKILTGLQTVFDSLQGQFDVGLREKYIAYWAAFAQQIRATRNEAGHPESIDPLSADTVHASFLVYPELAALSGLLMAWVQDNYETA